jgi:hypothetical protein
MWKCENVEMGGFVRGTLAAVPYEASAKEGENLKNQ